MTNSKTRQLLWAVIIIACITACLEGGASLMESYAMTARSSVPERPGWQAEYFRSLFDWHEPDPHLLWRFKANLDNSLITTNSRHLLGPDLSTDKPPRTCRILILGDSSPVGLGLAARRQTFGQRLRYLLEKHWADRKTVEIVNFAVSGYTSEQVVCQIERQVWDYDPDMAVLYCGNNDASVSGVHTDRELLSQQRLVGLRSFLSHSALYRVMRSLLLSALDPADDAGRPLTVRVTPEQFGENLAVIAAECRRRQVPLIVLKPPVPFLWPAGLQFKPFLHMGVHGGQVILPPPMARILERNIAYCLDEERLRDVYGKGDIFSKQVYRSAYADPGDPEQTIAGYAALLEHDSLDPATWNNLGVAYWKAGDYESGERMFRTARRVFERCHPVSTSPSHAAAVSPILFNLGMDLLSREISAEDTGYDSAGQAFVYLDSALQCDYFSLRIKRPYWKQIDNLKGTPGVTVIDLPKLFYENGGDRLFIDHCHPTAEGHLLIAATLFDSIVNRR